MTRPWVLTVTAAVVVSMGAVACSADGSTTSEATATPSSASTSTAPTSTTTIDATTTRATTTEATTTTVSPTTPPTTTTPPTDPQAPYVAEFELTWVAHPPPGPFDTPPWREYDVTVRLVITRNGVVEYDQSRTWVEREGGGDLGQFFTDTPDGFNHSYWATCVDGTCTGRGT